MINEVVWELLRGAALTTPSQPLLLGGNSESQDWL